MPTVDHLVRVYISDRVRVGHYTGSSDRTIRYVLGRFASYVGADLEVSKLTRKKVERWADSLDCAPATRRHKISAVRTFCAWLVHHDYLKVDPSTRLTSPRLPRYIPRGLDHAAIRALFAQVPDRRGEVIVSLMVQEGLRCVEVSNLQLGDVDLTEGVILVNGKGQHQRILPLSEETTALIRSYLSEHPASHGALVRAYDRQGGSTYRGLASQTISAMVGQWMADAGLKSRRNDGVSAHALRHTAATDMLKAGAHVRDVQAALGHVSLSTTQRYMPHVVKDLREAMGGRVYRLEDRTTRETVEEVKDRPLGDPPDAA